MRWVELIARLVAIDIERACCESFRDKQSAWNAFVLPHHIYSLAIKMSVTLRFDARAELLHQVCCALVCTACLDCFPACNVSSCIWRSCSCAFTFSQSLPGIGLTSFVCNGVLARLVCCIWCCCAPTFVCMVRLRAHTHMNGHVCSVALGGISRLQWCRTCVACSQFVCLAYSLSVPCAVPFRAPW
jgi:hypothetical protein